MGTLYTWTPLVRSTCESVKICPWQLVYTFDECGFRPGVGKSRKVIESKSKSKSCPDLADHLPYKKQYETVRSLVKHTMAECQGGVSHRSSAAIKADSSTLDESQYYD